MKEVKRVKRVKRVKEVKRVKRVKRVKGVKRVKEVKRVKRVITRGKISYGGLNFRHTFRRVKEGVKPGAQEVPLCKSKGPRLWELTYESKTNPIILSLLYHRGVFNSIHNLHTHERGYLLGMSLGDAG